MSIEKDYDIYIAVCDICGDDIGPFEDFYDAVDAKRAAGWRSRKDAHGEWLDLCPACQHPSAASDFGGVIGKEQRYWMPQRLVSAVSVSRTMERPRTALASLGSFGRSTWAPCSPPKMLP